MDEKWQQLKDWINESDNIVFFGGAGVSTESGIPDFRSVDGLYNQKYKYPPEQIISHSFYIQNPEEFYRFYKDRMLFPDAKPNAAHKALAKLEQEGKLKAVITQNKPDVVLYEEGLDDRTIQKSIDYIRNADMLIIGGTSLVVYPAAGLIDYYRGNKLVLINKSVTSRDSQADLVISDSIGKVLGTIVGNDNG